MKFDGLRKFFSSHGKKALFGAGLLPVAYLAWKNRGSIRKGVGDLRARATRGSEGKGVPLRMKDARKTDMVNTVRFMLSKYDTDAFAVIYDRDREQGWMGYHVHPVSGGPSISFGWSRGNMERYPATPFWITLDHEATNRFSDRGLKIHYDIYPNPLDGTSVLIPITLDEMEDPRTAAGKVAELARKLLL